MKITKKKQLYNQIGQLKDDVVLGMTKQIGQGIWDTLGQQAALYLWSILWINLGYQVIFHIESINEEF